MAAAINYEQLNTLNAAYARCIDDDQLESWPAFFREDCLYKVTTADNHREGLEAGMIYADSRGMLQDRVAALREANVYERHSYRHITGAPFIVNSGEAEAAVETPFIVVRTMRGGKTDVFATGKYIDRIVAESGQLQFAERIVVCDSVAVDTLLAIPL
ncbi:aromatic-ring-hydroxylating dioxygenase subunit beta [Noviherbaspirillum pedocola]|uniref:Aromatic-ring-hydroxylating dioxygenase subunit beta n=1 Tax=Noviherbaspirillum pedocola TaxID=2801341 RepID=A0A934SZP1_9BURK|nr:aromatic-ring-hydroxylating dioxygenase subunit beta [Noviherbaspirillum pedocola]MBK4738682.1 aromatic-ring-hydroxylating dioxygenase subunit beta [Noviherbaspirillum pedocola]